MSALGSRRILARSGDRGWGEQAGVLRLSPSCVKAGQGTVKGFGEVVEPHVQEECTAGACGGKLQLPPGKWAKERKPQSKRASHLFRDTPIQSGLCF